MIDLKKNYILIVLVDFATWIQSNVPEVDPGLAGSETLLIEMYKKVMMIHFLII